jgi:hypothetical protein
MSLCVLLPFNGASLRFYISVFGSEYCVFLRMRPRILKRSPEQAHTLLEKNWDRGLALIVFPLLLFTGWPFRLAGVVTALFVAAHAWIAYERYVHDSEIQWPVWVEWCAIAGGNAITLAPFTNGCDIVYWRVAVLMLAGQIISYGHVRKLAQPERAYYFDLPTMTQADDEVPVVDL